MDCASAPGTPSLVVEDGCAANLCELLTSIEADEVRFDLFLLASREPSAGEDAWRPVDVERGMALGPADSGDVASDRRVVLLMREFGASECVLSEEKMLASEAGRPETGMTCAWKVVSVLVVLIVLVAPDWPGCCCIEDFRSGIDENEDCERSSNVLRSADTLPDVRRWGLVGDGVV